MVEVRRRERESVEGLLRRFSRRVQQSRLLINARSSRFYTQPKSKREMRESALHKEKLLKERERLIKLGKIKKEDKIIRGKSRRQF